MTGCSEDFGLDPWQTAWTRSSARPQALAFMSDTQQPLPDSDGGLTVQPFTGSASEWNLSVARLDHGTFCHLWGWQKVFSETFGHDSHHWVVRGQDGVIQGLLPLVRLKSRLFGNNLISMPFLNYGGPIGSYEARRALADEAVRFGKEIGADLVELRDRNPLHLQFSMPSEKVTVLLSLPADAALLWEEGLRAKVRSQVRRPLKAGMTVAFGMEHLSAFYGVFCRNMRDLGTPVLPRRLFDSIADTFKNEFLVCTVYAGGKPVAAGCGFLYCGEFELTWASSRREYSKEAPNMLLYWSLMEEMIRRKATTFNFGRCTPGGGTHRFKLQWGGKDKQLYWTRWSPSGEGATPSVDKGLYKAAVSVWQRLPLPVANVLGPMISRSLPSW